MNLTFEDKTNCVNVQGDFINVFGMIGRRVIGKIKYDDFLDQYSFHLGVGVLSLNENVIRELNEKIEELKKIRGEIDETNI